ncbi:MAG: ParB/RepB/Spo0J family partition protein [Clostridia bacterium]|nr:ParB/RepB/Spo0J family partition protein [Clostridia bacterium]
MAKKGLGKGLDSIFADNYIEVSSKKDGLQTLRLSEIEPKADQPRKHFRDETLAELADSIREHGLIQPIVVRESGGGFYQIIAGERRWRASKLAGLSEVPVIIMDADALKAAELAIIENIHREDLNAYEEASAYKALIDEYGLTQDEVAQKVGKARTTITNSIRILDLPDDVIELMKTGDISGGHAKALLGLKNPEAIVPLAEDILVHSLSVRAVESIVKKLNKEFEKAQAPKEDKNEEEIVVDYVKDLEQKVMAIIGKQVKINSKGKLKTIQIEYVDNEDLNELLKKICGKDISD